MVHLTPAQQTVVEAVRRHIARRRCSPTLEELAAALGLSKPTVQGHVRTLCARKVLTKTRYAHRSLEVNEDAIAPEQRPTALPLLGRVAAGRPIDAIEEREWVDVGDVLGITGSREPLYLLQVRGDSMIDDGIFDGDYVIVEPRSTARDGETVVALMDDGTATLKRFYREKGRIRLQPANEKLKPIYARDVAVRGIVRGVVRSL